MKIALVGLGRTGSYVAQYLMEKQVLQMMLCRDTSKYEELETSLKMKAESIDGLEEKLRVNCPNVLIDFSGPAFLRDHIELLDQQKIGIVSAITEYTDEDMKRFKAVTKRGNIGLIMVPNITYGVNVMMLLVQLAANMMQDYDFELVEEHHNQKKDVPSGTAKKIAAQIDRVLEHKAKITPVHSIRSGGLVGKHKVIVAGKYDKIEISHESFSRMAFAEGAYKAAQFIHGKTGFYEMEDFFKEAGRHSIDEYEVILED